MQGNHKISVSNSENKKKQSYEKIKSFEQRAQQLSRGINKVIELCQMDEEKCNQNMKSIIQNEKQIYSILSKNNLSQSQLSEKDKQISEGFSNNGFAERKLNKNQKFHSQIENRILSKISQIEVDQQNKVKLFTLLNELQDQYGRNLYQLKLVNFKLLMDLVQSNKKISTNQMQDINLFRQIISLSQKRKQDKLDRNVTKSPNKQYKFKQNYFTFSKDPKYREVESNRYSKRIQFEIDDQSIEKQINQYVSKFSQMKNRLKFDANPYLQEMLTLLQQGQIIRKDLLQFIKKKQVEQEGSQNFQLRARIKELQDQLMQQQQGKMRFLNDVVAFKQNYKVLQQENTQLKNILEQKFSSQKQKPQSVIEKLKMLQLETEEDRQNYWQILENRKNNM